MLVKSKGPRLVFLMETKKKNSYMEKIRCHMKFDNMFLVPRRHFSGGLALFWSNDLDLHIRTFSPHHIDAVVNPRVDDAWRFTGFYRAPVEPQKLLIGKILGPCSVISALN